MANFPIKQFLGLRQTADPEIGTALSVSNFKRNVTRGRLENMDGAALLSALPSPAANLGYSSIVFKKPFSFYIADETGRNIYAVSATYTKAPHGYNGTPNTTAGVWISPYYDGGWQTGWRELTEYYCLKYGSSAASDDGDGVTFYIPLANGYGNDPSVLASIVTEGWVIVRNGDHSLTSSTGFKVHSLTGNTLRVYGRASDLVGWVQNSTVFYVYRNNIGGIFPASITSQFRGVLDEVRVNTGNGASDLDVALFYRDKTFFQGVSLARKGTFSEFGQLRVPSPTFKLRNASVVGSQTLGLEAGTYTLRQSMLMDDGQETELRDGLVGGFPNALSLCLNKSVTGVATGQGIATDGTSIFAAGGAAATYGFKALVKMDKDTLDILATVPLPTDWACVSIGVSNGLVYALCWNTVNYHWRLCSYDSGLGLVGTGADFDFGPVNYPVSNGLSLSRLSRGSFYAVTSNGSTTFYTARFSLTSLTGSTSRTFTTGSIYPMCLGESVEGDVYYSDASSHTPARLIRLNNAMSSETTMNLGGTAQFAEDGVFVGSALYVGANSSIYRIATDTFSTTQWKSGLSASGVWGITTDGTYLFFNNAYNTLVVLLADSNTFLTYYGSDLHDGNVLIGSNLYCASSTYQATIQLLIMSRASTTFTSNGYLYPQYDLAVSPGFVPRRASAVRVYINKDGGPYYLAKTYSILSGGETFSTTSVFDSTVQHRYLVRTGKTLTNADYSAATVTATAQLGRVSTDSGINRYLYAITANLKTYAIGMFVGGRVLRNRVFISAVSGDGIAQYDVLPNDVTTVLDVEFNDGDYAIALGNVADRVLVLKSKSLVMLTPDAGGGHTRDVVATGVGISSADTLVAFNEALYWLDATGVWEFTTRGLRNMSEGITSTIFGFSDANRAAAFAVIDPKHLQYRLFVNGVWYVLDLKDGEWTTETWPALTPTAAATDIGSLGRRYMWLVPSGGSAGIYNPATLVRYGTSNFTMSWQTNKIELPLERGYDGLLSAFYCDYSSPVNLTLTLYLDDYTNPARTYTLPLAGMGVVVPAPLACRCKSFKLTISATTTADGQSIQIRRLGAYFNQIPVGGDRHVVQEPGT
jgi:hypothetical protein